MSVIQGRVHQGRVEVHEPIPASWEGQLVKIIPLTPDDAVSDLDTRLAELHGLGPMEFEPGEKEVMARALEDLNRISKDTRGWIG